MIWRKSTRNEKAHNSGCKMQVSLYALVMLFGAIVAGVGLVLLFRKQEHSVSIIRIFNQEFQFSTPGLVVFMVGAVLLVLFPILHIDNTRVINFGSGGGYHDPNSGGVPVGGGEQ